MFPRDPNFDDKKVRRVDDAYPGYVIKELFDILELGSVSLKKNPAENPVRQSVIGALRPGAPGGQA